MNEMQNIIITQVYAQVSNDSCVDEDKIVKLVNFFRQLNPITDQEVESIIHELHSRLHVKMDRGYYLKENNHLPWYDASKKQLGSDQKYWNRYRSYLEVYQGFNHRVLDTLEISTDEMMDLLGNPKSESAFSRKGLVIGDVQSGKTSTYTGLINKAADSGYRIIILLTGTIEKLRQQTQSRLDAGFVGIDSEAYKKNKQKSYIGVGNLDSSIQGWSVTSVYSDFKESTAKQYNNQLKNVEVPVLFVLKKNKSVLEKLEKWLRLHNANNNGEIESPLLLIDDEADNASINTNKEENNPSTINACIRKLLKLFVRSNYVAFTATPYANIFIDPDTDDEMLGDELFPRDFIYLLNPPTNYIGAEGIFSENGKYRYMLKDNRDCEFFVPEKHKKEHEIDELPETLKEAIISFLIISTICDMRGHNKSHRTMLINISRFINVQDQIKDLVNGFLISMKREVTNYSKAGERALQHDSIALIQKIYNKHFRDLNKTSKFNEKHFTWESILSNMTQAISPIVVKSINGGNASKNLNYGDHEEDGLRLIAVGGFSLSRGLTLEGLCVSYFYRNSKMYDTLMQMGRWFGYRNHYEDLCQIWMPEDSVLWYREISEATTELKNEISKMQNANLTPSEFGLGVRSNQAALIVTAVNKMRYTESLEMKINNNGTVIETAYIDADKDANLKNIEIVDNWLKKIRKNGILPSKEKNNQQLALNGKIQYLNVPRNYVIELLDEVIISPFNYRFEIASLINTIKDYESLEKWDIVIASGSGRTIKIGDFDIKLIQRSFGIKEFENKKTLMMNDKKLRLGSTSYATAGLTKLEKQNIESKVKSQRLDNVKDKNFTQNDYFSISLKEKRNPLLVIYPIELKNENNDKTDQDEYNRKAKVSSSINGRCIGFAIGLPSNGTNPIKSIYRINKIKYREILGITDDEYLEELGDNYD